MIWFTAAAIVAFAVCARGDAPGSCLGEYQHCSDKGDCVLDSSLCGTCSQGQYLCPDTKTCVNDVESYTTCPGLKGGFFDWALSLDERVSALDKQATLEEKIAQLTNDAPAIVRLGIPSYNWLNDDEHGVHEAHATSFPNGCALGAMWDKQTMLKVGAAVGLEARVGHNGYVHTGDRGHGENGAGITLYAPNMNLVRDPRWGRAQEVYSEDPVLSAFLTYMFVHGAQVGNETSPKYMQSAACCKHYAAYDVETIPTDRYEFSATVDSRNMWETYMPVFLACVKYAQGAHVMCSYNAINGIPTCANPDLLNGILRKQWDWPGFVVSDYDAWQQIYTSHHYCPNITCAAAAGLNAGMDQEGGGTSAINHLKDAIGNKTTTEEAVSTAFKRLFRVRLQLGMHDPPKMVEWNMLTNDSIVEGPADISLARQAAHKGMTLYKNKNNVLPLSKNIKKLALIGPSATDGNVLLGNYAVPPDHGIPTIQDGIYQSLGIDPVTFKGNCSAFEQDIDYFIPGEPGTDSPNPQNCCNQCAIDIACNYFTWSENECFKKKTNKGRQSSKGRVSAKCLSHARVSVSTSLGCFDTACSDNTQFDFAVQAANNSDAIVVVLGLSGKEEGEGHDRNLIELPGNQPGLVSQLRVAYEKTPIIVVLVHGGTLALGSVLDDADAILDAWYPGMEGGLAVGDVLFGDFNPAGRASVTSYLSTESLPEQGNTNLYPSGESPGITYRYYTEKVQFPFGFGLSYTTFKYSDLKLSSQSVKACDTVTVTVTVTNTGDKDGDEVVQVYLKHVKASVPVPKVRLADFARVTIAKGQSTRLELMILPRTHCVVPDNSDIYTDRSTVESGEISVYVGGGQPDFYTGGLSSSFHVTTSALAATCPDPELL
ncbi:uncharacterized protein LOC135828788 [Sycon ciliatum]|uniref:uncharacterized protein LOC135828788 n=1 Tax=Sycon ciliatum TaxID=27933 RepID=UPI0031F63511